MKDPKVGGGSEGTCKVIQNQLRHVPRSNVMDGMLALHMPQVHRPQPFLTYFNMVVDPWATTSFMFVLIYLMLKLHGAFALLLRLIFLDSPSTFLYILALYLTHVDSVP
ncbi:hypothetical protein Lal_00041427 [Lupinus albus]|nr:hypothetical protein Lal_00041427 [Lupinus albus]